MNHFVAARPKELRFILDAIRNFEDRQLAAANAFYGWFDDPDQTAPTYEPPRDAPCLFCGADLHADDVRTHSLMVPSAYATRSYFYRTHRSCAEDNSEDTDLDGFVLRMIERNGD